VDIKKHNISAVILAAGLSERMGKPKFLLTWQKISFIENLINQYINFGCDTISIVLNPMHIKYYNELNIISKKIKIAVNNHPEYGRFYSLQKGLQNIRPYYNCFVSNVDNPFAEQDLLERMTQCLAPEKYVVPVYNKIKGHPVLLDVNIIKDILAEKSLNLNIKDYLQKYIQVNCPANSDKVLININTPEAYISFIDKYTNAK